MTKRRRIAYEIKQKIVEEFERGEGTAQELGRKYGVHPINIYQWKKKFAEGTMVDRPSKKEKELSKEVEYYKKKVAELTRHVDLLKKLQEESSQRQKKSAGLRSFKMRLAASSEPAE